jgi:hypothetical protein
MNSQSSEDAASSAIAQGTDDTSKQRKSANVNEDVAEPCGLPSNKISANDEVDDFGVPHVITAEWMRAHIAELKRIEAEAASKFEEFLGEYPNPVGDTYIEAWRLRQRREGARGLIESHTASLRLIEKAEKISNISTTTS